MSLDRSTLAAVLGTQVPAGDPAVFTSVTHDSRRARPGGIFVAIPGFTSDGAQFAAEAMNMGAALVVAQKDIPGVPVAVVPDARAALADISVAIEGDPSTHLTVYGITGTNGKTTSSYVLHSMLSAAFGAEKTGLMTTAEVVVGTARRPAVRTTAEANVLQRQLAQMVEEGVQQVVVETSSHGLALQRVRGIHYAAALFTNLSRDHLDLHNSMEEYYATKKELFTLTSGPCWANGDDPWGQRLVRDLPHVRTFGRSRDSQVRIVDERIEPGVDGGACFSLELPDDLVARVGVDRIDLRTPLLGDYNVLNVAGAAVLALSLGMSAQVLVAAVRDMSQVPGRFERIREAGRLGFEVIVDYAHTHVGLLAALRVARQCLSDQGRLIVVYGATGRRDPMRRPLMGQVVACMAEVGIITTDDSYDESPQEIANQVAAGVTSALDKNVEPEILQAVPSTGAASAFPTGHHKPRHQSRVILNREQAIAAALMEARAEDIVLIAGKGHERVQHLPDGDVIFHDPSVVRRLLG